MALPSQDLTYSWRWVCLNDHGDHQRHQVGRGFTNSTSAQFRLGGTFLMKKHGLPCISYLENNSKITTPGYNGNGLWELRAPPLSARVGLTGPSQDICWIFSQGGWPLQSDSIKLCRFLQQRLASRNCEGGEDQRSDRRGHWRPRS